MVDGRRIIPILSVFRKTGIRPFDASIFTDADYALSENLLILARVSQCFAVLSDDGTTTMLETRWTKGI